MATACKAFLPRRPVWLRTRPACSIASCKAWPKHSEGSGLLSTGGRNTRPADETTWPTLAAAWNYVTGSVQDMLQPEAKTLEEQAEKIEAFADAKQFSQTLFNLRQSLTVGSPHWPHTPSEGDAVTTELRRMAQALVCTKKTLGSFSAFLSESDVLALSFVRRAYCQSLQA